MNLAIIGLGRMGNLIFEHLKNDFNTKVHDQDQTKLVKIDKTQLLEKLEELQNVDIVILAVPISQIEATCQQISPHLKPNSLLIDTCSVKEYPLAIIQKNVSETINILGSHPMFGPDSVRQTLAGCKIVLCPIRLDDKKLQAIKDYLSRNNLTVIESTPEEHDKQISETLVLTHFIGRGLEQIKATPLSIDTKGHRRLLRILETVVNDTWQLFEDMNNYNPHAKSKRQQFIQALEKIDKGLK